MQSSCRGTGRKETQAAHKVATAREQISHTFTPHDGGCSRSWALAPPPQTSTAPEEGIGGGRRVEPGVGAAAEAAEKDPKPLRPNDFRGCNAT